MATHGSRYLLSATDRSGEVWRSPWPVRSPARFAASKIRCRAVNLVHGAWCIWWCRIGPGDSALPLLGHNAADEGHVAGSLPRRASLRRLGAAAHAQPALRQVHEGSRPQKSLLPRLDRYDGAGYSYCGPQQDCQFTTCLRCIPECIGVDVKVSLTQPCIFCMDNQQ